MDSQTSVSVNPIATYYPTLFDQSTAMVVVWKSADLLVEYANPAAQKFTSYKLIQGTSIYDFIPVEADPFIKMLEQVYENGQPSTASELRVLFDMTGSGLQEYFLNISFQPIKNEDGAVSSVLNFIHDVSELVKARKVAEENEIRLRMAVESTGIGTWEYVPVTGYLKWSDECKKIYGVPADIEPEMDFFYQHVYSEDKEFVESSIAEAMTVGKGSYNIEFRIVQYNDGSVKWIKSVGKVYFTNDVASRFIGVVMDITEEKNKNIRLAQTNERAQLVLGSLPEMAWTAYPDGKVNYVSARWFEFTGQSIDDAVDLDWVNALHPEHRQKALNYWNEMIGKGEPFEMQNMIWHEAEKKYKWFWVKSLPLKDKNGEIFLWTGTLTDFHEQIEFTRRLKEEVSKHTDELQIRNKELHLQNQFIRTILDASAHLIVVFDKDLRLTEANKVCETRFGLQKKNVIGRHYLEIFPGTENTPTYNDMVNALKGTYIHNDVRKSDIMDGYFENHFIPLFRDEEVYGLVVIAHDITELVKTADKLKHSEMFLQSVLNSTQNGIAIYEPVYEKDQITDFRIIYTNRQGPAVVGKEPETIVGELCSKVYPSIFTDGIFEKLVECKLTGNPMRYTADLDYNGEQLSFTASMKTLDNSIIITTADVTEEKKSQAKLATAYDQLSLQNKLLESQNNELASFTYIASHDLQEPLRKIRTFCGIILEQSPDMDAVTKNYFDRVNKAVNRMQHLIEALLSYSKTNSETGVIEHISLQAILQEVLDNEHEMIKEKNAVITSDPLPAMNIMHVQFVQLFTNLISNALKYSRKDVPVKIHISHQIVDASEVPGKGLETEKTFSRISFRDNGIGFDQQYEERIFQLFQRLHGRMEYEGTGIGLAICKKVVQNHKGIIKATGIPGEGSVFDIYFPLR